MKKLIDYPTLSTDAGTRAIRTDVDFDNTVGSFRLIPAPVVEAADAVVEAAKDFQLASAGMKERRKRIDEYDLLVEKLNVPHMIPGGVKNITSDRLLEALAAYEEVSNETR